MKLTRQEAEFLMACLAPLKQSPPVQRMRKDRKHRDTDTYHHGERVAFLSLWMARRLKKLGISLDDRAMVRGGFLHDFYLYGHATRDVLGRYHARIHPRLAAQNARRYFKVSPLEQDIIRHHMWPIDPHHAPKSLEALLVNLADKLCTAEEYFGNVQGRATRNELE